MTNAIRIIDGRLLAGTLELGTVLPYVRSRGYTVVYTEDGVEKRHLATSKAKLAFWAKRRAAELSAR